MSQKIKITVEVIDTDSQMINVSSSYESQEIDSAKLEDIDQVEEAFLCSSHNAIRQALNEHLSCLSKKKCLIEGKQQ